MKTSRRNKAAANRAPASRTEVKKFGREDFRIVEDFICVEKLDHLVLTVKDIRAACDFYRRVLGMREASFGDNRTALHFGCQKINLHTIDNDITLKAEKPAPGSADLCFITKTPLPEAVARLRLCKVEILTGPVERAGASGKIISVYFRDPDSNLIELSNYAD